MDQIPRLNSARAESTNSAIGFIQLIYLNERDNGNLLDYELCNTFALSNNDVIVRIKIDCADFEFAAIMGIDQPRRIGH